MEAGMIFALAMLISIAIAPVYGKYYSQTVTPSSKVEKVTRLHFFLHDILSGENPSAVIVARANLTKKGDSVLPFGSLVAIDDPLRVGPDPTSEIIGNAQGLYLSASQDASKFTIVLYADLAFTSGKFNGSSFSIFSRNPVLEADREVAVVGGRGKFRMARGYAKIKSSHFNATTGDAILDYKVTLYHY
ncbi:Dirigent protein 15 [Hibiscus syriacus]|uniref:Dirigent protein n=1 Tax=Hibiscus syriacus TaxID=106335 RepID=A0A6A3A6H2_HIBSY|nr:dirigent protein 15-like [Hibiscus syriacus]KAE8698719.1 Dirigent protein 15 [Hibiscus syriacus]